ncbi:uncharacterized protein LOC123875483 [Maniola jurtina]|uniref:uncharacterized protein LOC123875483 n=1 Tax=Maniola jurtina TaxID=191418 RepID=UPI001E68BD2D|nr:uncharacterized protein LOC123875483 [Maniola jurtina]
MYRLLCFLAILTFVSAHCRWENNKRVCPWTRKHPRRFHRHHIESESIIEDIKKKFIESEIKLQELCNKNENVIVKEKYDIDTYTLEYTLEETENLNITVQIFHRLIQTTVMKNDTNALVFEDLKVLPGVVKLEDAAWKLKDKDLKIRIPYKVPFGKEATMVCEAINTGVINVQQAEDNYDLDVRFGNDTLFNYREKVY